VISNPARVGISVARWYVFKPKKNNIGKFWGGFVLEDVGIYVDILWILCTAK
jgi:hypothetical protein